MTEFDELETDVECSICGKAGGPAVDCGICHGNGQFVQSRAYTLSDERSGRAPQENRYGRDGALGPTIVNLPGADPRRH